MVAKKKTAQTGVVKSVQAGLPEDQLGDRLRAKRAELRLTHDGLSELTKIADVEGRGIARTSIRGYELGTYKPGAREIRILSVALKVSPSWLLLGGEEEACPPVTPPAAGRGASKTRWADVAMPMLAYSQLGVVERKQVCDLIETLYRIQVGEIKFRPMKAFVEDFVDTVQDAIRDSREHGNLNSETMRAVFLDTVAEMRKKHGPEEAQLLFTLIEPLIAIYGDIAKSK